MNFIFLAAFIPYLNLPTIPNSLPLINRGLKTKITGSDGKSYDIYVLKNTVMPAVLVETAFIDNAYDANLLREREDDFYATPLPDVVD